MSDEAPINAVIRRADELLAVHQAKADRGGGTLPENPYALLREVKDWLAETEALRKQLAEFGAGEDTTTMTRKSFAEVLQALADVQKELAETKAAKRDPCYYRGEQCGAQVELATLREQHSNVLRENECQRQDIATKNARIAELVAAGTRLGDTAIDAVLDGMGYLEAGRDTTEALRKELAASRKWNQDLLDAARETRPDDDRRAAEWGLAVFADLKKTQKELAEAKAVLEISDDTLQTALETAKARIAELKADRKRLDARIHRQRLSNRTNWEIVEARGNIMGSPKAREAYCRLLGWLKDQRARAERAEAECKATRALLDRWRGLADNGNWRDDLHRSLGAIQLTHDTRAALNPSPAGPVPE